MQWPVDIVVNRDNESLLRTSCFPIEDSEGCDSLFKYQSQYANMGGLESSLARSALPQAFDMPIDLKTELRTTGNGFHLIATSRAKVPYCPEFVKSTLHAFSNNQSGDHCMWV